MFDNSKIFALFLNFVTDKKWWVEGKQTTGPAMKVNRLHIMSRNYTTNYKRVVAKYKRAKITPISKQLIKDAL